MTEEFPVKVVPTPKASPLFGLSKEMIEDTLGLMERLSQEHGEIVRIPLFGIDGYLVSDPELIKIVFQKTERDFVKTPKLFRRLRAALGNGLVTSGGDFWKQQRRMVNPAFHRKSLAQFETIIQRTTQEMLQNWEEKEQKGKTINIAEEMMSLTLYLVVLALFSTDIREKIEDIGVSLKEIQAYTIHLFWSPLPLPKWIPTPRNLRYLKAIKVMDEIVYGVIQERRENGNPKPDLLAMLMQTVDEESGNSMSDSQLRDEVLTMFIAGHDTTANGLAFTYNLLTQNDRVYQKLEEELASVLENRLPTFADLPKLVYTRMVFEEGMRLFPPVWTVNRCNRETFNYKGYEFPPNSVFFLSQWITHRNPRFWEKPDEFYPERFAPEESKSRPKFAYFPFGGGPRVCIGTQLALMEGQMILAMTLQKFRMSSVPGQKFTLAPQVTLSPVPGIEVKIQRKKHSENL